jgi:hypothetical protein
MTRLVAPLVASGGTAVALAATATPAHAAGLPGAGIVTDAIGGMAGWGFEKMAAGIAGWVLEGVAYFANGVLNFLKTSARPQVDAAWFAGPGSPLATVRSLAVALIGGFLFLGVLQGLAHGSSAQMLRRLVADLPMAVLGIVATVTVVTKLLDLTDALSTAVLSQADGQGLRFLSQLGTVTIGGQGFAVVVVGLVAILAALALWVELMVRSALVYLLVAVSPLAFAAMVWPAARGVLRRTAHLLLAVIVSKFVIAVAIAVGVAALGGPAGNDGSMIAAAPLTAGGAAGDFASLHDPAAGLGTLLVGGVVLALAAFAPFIVLRLIPVAEAALAAQGVSRGPLRAAQSGVGTYYYANSVTRLGGSRSPAMAGGPAPLGTGPGSPTAPPSPVAVGTSSTGGASGAGGPAGAAAAATSAARAAGRRAATAARQAPDVAPPKPAARPPERHLPDVPSRAADDNRRPK